MTTIAPAAFIVGAGRQSLPYGLFSTLTFRPDASGRWENGSQFETIDCSPAGGRAFDCDPEVIDPDDLAKNVNVGEAVPFGVFGHFACSPLGYSDSDAQKLALAHLEAHEEQRVEQAFWTGDLANTPSLAGVGTATPNGVVAVKPKIGLGILEQWIAEHYGAQGVIHMTRALAAATGGDQNLRVQGNVLRTMLGTPVAAGGGYPGTGPAGQAIANHQSWAYVSPALFGYRSAVFYPSNRPFDGLNRAKNDLTTLAERTYLLGYDPCGVAAVLIDPTI